MASNEWGHARLRIERLVEAKYSFKKGGEIQKMRI